MMLPDGKSALVRLSDCIKLGMGNALDTTVELLGLHAKHGLKIARIREITQQALDGRISQQEAESSLRAPDAAIPFEDAQIGLTLHGRLHSEVLSVILNVCFTLESYINTYGYHLLKERDILGLVARSNPSTAEAFFDAIDRMSTLSKWETIGRLKSEIGFAPATTPFQDLKILFRFRDDHVHDKVVYHGSDRPKKRYGGKLPDPVEGALELDHAIYACDCYWNMVLEIHSLTSSPKEDFHKHYNLSPWFDSEFESRVRRASRAYVATRHMQG